MKKYLFLLVAVVSLALSPGRAYAQRYLPKMKGVELRGGFVNGSKSPLNYYTGIAMSGYTKKANRWVVGAEYLLKNYDYRGMSLAVGYETRLRAGDEWLPIAPLCPRYCLNLLSHCSHCHLNHAYPFPTCGKIVFHETSPWCRQGWGPILLGIRQECTDLGLHN